MSLDPTSPNNIEAEEALIASALLDPQVLKDNEHITGDAFWKIRHQWVWEAMRRLDAKDQAIDYVTLLDELTSAGQLDEIGGPAYLTRLSLGASTSLYADAYAAIVEEKHLRRRMLAVAGVLAKRAHDESGDIRDQLEESEKDVLAIAPQYGVNGVASAVDIGQRVLATVIKARESGVSGIETGFTDLDRMTGGLQNADLIVIAGRPGMGKTSFQLSLVGNVCPKKTRPLIISKEMTAEQLFQRLVSQESGITTDQMRRGKLDDAEFSTFCAAVDTVSQFTFFVEDGEGKHVDEVRKLARRAKSDHKVDLILIDFLTLLTGPGDSEHQRVTYIIRSLKEMARELKVPVVVAAQLNRKVEDRKDKHPQLSDLRESGSIEEAADIVLFLYRDEVYNEHTERPNQTDLVVAKHRNGPTGAIQLYFRKERTQFTNLSKTEIDLAGFGDTETNARPHTPAHDYKRAAAGERSDR
jgi:replicative DNA helicase